MISRVFEFLSRRIDGPLMAALALALALGVTVVYSASGGSSFDRAMGQAEPSARKALAAAVSSGWRRPSFVVAFGTPVAEAGAHGAIILTVPLLRRRAARSARVETR